MLFSSYVSSLQADVATETEMLIPALLQKYIYFKQLAMCPHGTPAETRI